jgi:FeS assembly SUF system regulator
MIKISRLADYGLIILNYLVAQPQLCYSAAVLAERTGIALPTVSKVLKLLNEAQVISSSRGPSGGYRLIKDPQQINLAEIIAAVDGVPALTECCQIDNGCIHDARCALRSNWQLINRVIINALSQFTLADLKQPLVLKNLGDRHV